MAGSSTRNCGSGIRNGVRVFVAGDQGTGKSSLIAAVASEAFPEKISPVLPTARLPADYFPDLVPITIIDTSSSPEGKFKRNEELKRADAVVLTYACDQPAALTRLRNYWLPELRPLEWASIGSRKKFGLFDIHGIQWRSFILSTRDQKESNMS